MNISNDPLYMLFLKSRNLKASSIQRYKVYLTLYSEFIDKKPKQWIEEAEYEEDHSIRKRQRKIKKHLIDYNEFLESKGYSPRTIAAALTITRTFYKEFDIQLPIQKVNRKYRPETIDDIPNMDEIRKALNHANIKYKAIILLMLSSGMRSSDIRNLKYHDFLISLKDFIKIPKEGYVQVDEVVELVEKSKKEIVPTWKITAEKNNIAFITFSTPESLEAILDYLKLKPPRDLKCPLFRSNRFPDQGISKPAFMKYFKDLNDLCGFGKIDKQIKFRSHSLRKFFTTTLYHKQLNKLTIDWLLAHKIDSVTDSYFKSDIKSLRNEYIKCLPDLSIEKTEARIVESDEYKKLTEQYENDSKAKEEEIKKLKAEKDEEMANIKKKMELMDKMMKDLMTKQLKNE